MLSMGFACRRLDFDAMRQHGFLSFTPLRAWEWRQYSSCPQLLFDDFNLDGSAAGPGRFNSYTRSMAIWACLSKQHDWRDIGPIRPPRRALQRDRFVFLRCRKCIFNNLCKPPFSFFLLKIDKAEEYKHWPAAERHAKVYDGLRCGRFNRDKTTIPYFACSTVTPRAQLSCLALPGSLLWVTFIAAAPIMIFKSLPPLNPHTHTKSIAMLGRSLQESETTFQAVSQTINLRVKPTFIWCRYILTGIHRRAVVLN